MSDLSDKAEIVFNKKWKVDPAEIEKLLSHYLNSNYFKQ
jgi:hypothetical protein